MKTIVIDPGHGMNDPGAVGNGLKEKELTLKIAKRIEAHLAGRATVRLTRSDDTTFSKEKSKDLSERAAFANWLKADYFISIHINAGGGTGFESFIYDKSTNKESERIRSIIHKRAASVFVQKGMKDRGKKAANHAVTRQTNMPSSLIEYGFIDNAVDAKYLSDENFIDEVAKATAEGIAEALSLPVNTKEDVKVSEPTTRDINVVSSWAAAAWEEAKANGYFDGSRPGAPITREESAVVMNRLRKNFLTLIGGNSEKIAELEKRLQEIEKEAN